MPDSRVYAGINEKRKRLAVAEIREKMRVFVCKNLQRGLGVMCVRGVCNCPQHERRRRGEKGREKGKRERGVLNRTSDLTKIQVGRVKKKKTGEVGGVRGV